MNPHTRCLTHVLCIAMSRSRMINQPCRHVYKEMRMGSSAGLVDYSYIIEVKTSM